MKALNAVASMAASLLLASCATTSHLPPPTNPGHGLTHAASSFTVTSALDCLAQTETRNSFALFPIGLVDNGRTYTMHTCQAVDVVIAHPGTDGCQWTQIQSSDEAALNVFPLPLPAPPPGGVNEAWIASVPGQATLTSSLACPGGVTTHWAVTFVVTP